MSKQQIPDISDLLERIPLGERADGARALVQRAYAVAEQAHAGQTRKSGEPYIQHPLAVAFLLTDMRMDPGTVAAGLLHDVVEDCSIDLKQLTQDFGSRVASLVDGVTKLEQIDRPAAQAGEKMTARQPPRPATVGAVLLCLRHRSA